ncbi:MAG: retroviral-like aspartic protease family protein [Saprospiraceae bacterium]|nr:retroviral-like aspartic protease family protein [Candidatus Defluviibacterium haderslevense]MBK7243821.1 retroviral-like aspartic protease family protein [Candidatus Defluviibacterium haderslevense]
MNNPKILITSFVVMLISGCSGCSSKKNDTSYLDVPPYNVPIEEVLEQKEPGYGSDLSSIAVYYTEQYGNTITIPIKINGMGLDMIYDTGASSTFITLAEAKYLYEKGNLAEEDLIDYQQYQTANGQIVVGLRINLRNFVIGDKITLHNIEAVVIENQQAPLLLGQSVMKLFREISVDRENKVVKFSK